MLVSPPGFWFNLNNMYIQKKLCSFSNSQEHNALYHDSYIRSSPENQCWVWGGFKFWSLDRSPAWCSPKRSYQVAVGVTGVNIFLVTKCMGLDIVLDKDLLGSLAVLLLPRRVAFSILFWFLVGVLGSTDILLFPLQHWKGRSKTLCHAWTGLYWDFWGSLNSRR